MCSTFKMHYVLCSMVWLTQLKNWAETLILGDKENQECDGGNQQGTPGNKSKLLNHGY